MTATASNPRFSGHCVDCDRSAVEVQTRYSHAAKVLCDSCAALPHSSPTVHGLEDAPAATNGAKPATVAPDVFPLLSVADLANLKPPEFLIDGILPAGGFSVLFGPSGVGKSFLALDWALCVASGLAWYGNQSKPGWVLYIAAEGRSGLGIRVQAWQHGRRQAEVERIRFLPEAVNFLDAAHLAKARRTLTELPEPPVLVVVDTMARSMIGGDENAARDVGMFIDAADELCKASGAARLIVHHTGKNGEDERGSSALRGAADLMAALKPDDAGIRLECVKAKDSEEFEPWNLHLESVLDSCQLRLGSSQATVSPAERQILESLTEGFGSDPVASGVLQRASGVADRSYYRALKALDDKGFLDREQVGRTTRITLTDAGATVLLPTSANDCQADAAITAATPPPLGGGSSRSGSDATDDEQRDYERALALVKDSAA